MLRGIIHCITPAGSPNRVPMWNMSNSHRNSILEKNIVQGCIVIQESTSHILDSVFVDRYELNDDNNTFSPEIIRLRKLQDSANLVR